MNMIWISTGLKKEVYTCLDTIARISLDISVLFFHWIILHYIISSAAGILYWYSNLKIKEEKNQKERI